MCVVSRSLVCAMMCTLMNLTLHRLTLNPIFAAVTTLLNNVIHHPLSPHAHSDLQAIEPFLGLLGVLTGDQRQCSRSDEAERMLPVCEDLKTRASEAIQLMSTSLLDEQVGIIANSGI